MNWWLLLGFLNVIVCSQGVLGSAFYCVDHYQKPLRHRTRSCPPLSEKRSATNDQDLPRIYVHFQCGDPDIDACNKAKALFSKAGDIISSVLKLETAIHVNATYLPFCKTFNECDTDKDGRTIGQAFPTVSYLMTDPTDNVTRMYPQAILKQFTHVLRPSWTTYDMNAQFNSEVNWYFQEEGVKMKSDQTDFLRTVIHEYIHGLGFITGWTDRLYHRFRPYADPLTAFLTPMMLSPPNQTPQIRKSFLSDDGLQPFWGFVEFPLDKFIHHNKTKLSTMTQILNKLGNSNVLYKSLLDMINDWCDSNIKDYAEFIYKRATSSRNLAVVVGNHTTLWLETNLTPFLSGSSMSHVDYDLYNDTEDYLMVYKADPGVDLDMLSQKFPLGPLGPNLVRTLAGLGYAIQPTFSIKAEPVRPDLQYWQPSASLVGTDKNPSPAVSTVHGPAHIPQPTHSISPSSSSAHSSVRCRSSLYIITIVLTLSLLTSLN
ncbi:uncharacterized protein BYT42DRAFT_565624 [Radiomyces spectabilis]|uniref:uncharacterized protein n=1 Tax=Radiomyces spectabilis TaxID=64574 RepID=UPI00221F1FE9|nr:uncharacterized protein BYT42DRAFT_565624 [Radiomyces spectabilis]KAI8381185.1 hypothetical protein BYT42DRAFT_565624 [Radiomyces spectabilis]